MTDRFHWFGPDFNAPVVTVAEYGLVFNQGAAAILGNPDEVLLGFDPVKLVIGIRAAVDGEERGFPFASRERGGYIRVNNKDFMRYVFRHFDREGPERAIRSIALWDDAEKLMTVDLSHLRDEESEDADDAPEAEDDGVSEDLPF